MTDVLVVGSGAREHALAWKLRASPDVGRLLVAPGNGGTAAIPDAENVKLGTTDVQGLLQLALDRSVGLTIVGPELPLALGLVDKFQERGLPVFGPTRQAARLEWSKSFSRQLTSGLKIPSPDFHAFNDFAEAESFLLRHQGPIVVKADGLAAGKGVMVCDDRDEALAALRQCMKERAFGSAGDMVVLEERICGPEVSVFAFCDGERVSAMTAASDYKRAFDGDKGPNTGGMGAYSPSLPFSDLLDEQVRQRIMQPVVTAMAERGDALSRRTVCWPYVHQGWAHAAGVQLPPGRPRNPGCVAPAGERPAPRAGSLRHREHRRDQREVVQRRLRGRRPGLGRLSWGLLHGSAHPGSGPGG